VRLHECLDTVGDAGHEARRCFVPYTRVGCCAGVSLVSDPCKMDGCLSKGSRAYVPEKRCGDTHVYQNQGMDPRVARKAWRRGETRWLWGIGFGFTKNP
jgi:hypothetical protein